MKIVGWLAVGLVIYYVWCEMNKPGGLSVPSFTRRPVPNTTQGSITIDYGNGWTSSVTVGNSSPISTGNVGSGNGYGMGMVQ